MIYIGTSGYSYDDWKGIFYNNNIDKSSMLQEYSKKFAFTEINSTYYKLPNRFMFWHLVNKTHDNFKFTVKLHSSMTHSRDAGEREYRAFNDSLLPLTESGKLGCVVAQFPNSFHSNPQNIEYILNLKKNIENKPLSVEFRNQEWCNADTYRKLVDEGIGFVCVDEPDLKGLLRHTSVVTSNIGYIRFHGRNSQKWYNHKESYERYDYMYSEDILNEWIPRINFINENTDITFIAFNNHFRAQGAINALMLQRLLENHIYKADF